VKQSLILSKWFNPSAFSNLDLSIYPWQDESICQMTNQYGCIGSTASVCSNTLGNSKQSICDLAGNVYEWVRDEWQVNLLNSSHLAHMPFCNDENCESSEVNRQSIEINRVQRGGSFLENARFLKTTTRRYSSQNIKSPLIGFRWIKYLNE
jgi:formylglycine-generating enzyme required for sulfatase activity